MPEAVTGDLQEEMEHRQSAPTRALADHCRIGREFALLVRRGFDDPYVSVGLVQLNILLLSR